MMSRFYISICMPGPYGSGIGSRDRGRSGNPLLPPSTPQHGTAVKACQLRLCGQYERYPPGMRPAHPYWAEDGRERFGKKSSSEKRAFDKRSCAAAGGDFAKERTIATKGARLEGTQADIREMMFGPLQPHDWQLKVMRALRIMAVDYVHLHYGTTV